MTNILAISNTKFETNCNSLKKAFSDNSISEHDNPNTKNQESLFLSSFISMHHVHNLFQSYLLGGGGGGMKLSKYIPGKSSYCFKGSTQPCCKPGYNMKLPDMSLYS